MKTVMAKKETVSREWLLIDAAGLPLGRVASKVAFILRGKHKPDRLQDSGNNAMHQTDTHSCPLFHAQRGLLPAGHCSRQFLL